MTAFCLAMVGLPLAIMTRAIVLARATRGRGR